MKRPQLIRSMAGASLALLLTAPVMFADQPGSAKSLDEAVKMAAEQGIPLVLDFYTDW